MFDTIEFTSCRGGPFCGDYGKMRSSVEAKCTTNDYLSSGMTSPLPVIVAEKMEMKFVSLPVQSDKVIYVMW